MIKQQGVQLLALDDDPDLAADVDLVVRTVIGVELLLLDTEVLLQPQCRFLTLSLEHTAALSQRVFRDLLPFVPMDPMKYLLYRFSPHPLHDHNSHGSRVL